METITVFSRKEFRDWLKKNHKKESKVIIILHKKHMGKKTFSHREQIEEAICFGWIDTTVKRVDEDTYSRSFTKRTKNSRWRYNTLSYEKELEKKGLMSEQGLKYYKEGLAKLPHDHGIPKNPEMPEELEKALEKNKKAKDNFEKYPPSTKKLFYRWILRGKREETRKKRIKLIIEKAKVNKRDILTTQEKVNN